MDGFKSILDSFCCIVPQVETAKALQPQFDWKYDCRARQANTVDGSQGLGASVVLFCARRSEAICNPDNNPKRLSLCFAGNY